jgi:hypothetical protein
MLGKAAKQTQKDLSQTIKSSENPNFQSDIQKIPLKRFKNTPRAPWSDDVKTTYLASTNTGYG